MHLASGESLSESLGMLDGHARLFVAAVDVRSAAELELLEIFDFSQVRPVGTPFFIFYSVREPA